MFLFGYFYLLMCLYVKLVRFIRFYLLGTIGLYSYSYMFFSFLSYFFDYNLMMLLSPLFVTTPLFYITEGYDLFSNMNNNILEGQYGFYFSAGVFVICTTIALFHGIHYFFISDDGFFGKSLFEGRIIQVDGKITETIGNVNVKYPLKYVYSKKDNQLFVEIVTKSNVRKWHRGVSYDPWLHPIETYKTSSNGKLYLANYNGLINPNSTVPNPPLRIITPTPQLLPEPGNSLLRTIGIGVLGTVALGAIGVAGYMFAYFMDS